MHSPAPTIDAKSGIFSRYPQVAPERDLKTARNRVTFHCRNRRLREQHARDPQRPIAFFCDLESARLIRHGSQIEPGTEGSICAGQYSDGQRLISIKSAKSLSQRRSRWPINGVTHCWPINGYNKDGSDLLGQDSVYDGIIRAHSGFLPLHKRISAVQSLLLCSCVAT